MTLIIGVTDPIKPFFANFFIRGPPRAPKNLKNSKEILLNNNLTGEKKL